MTASTGCLPRVAQCNTESVWKQQKKKKKKSLRLLGRSGGSLHFPAESKLETHWIIHLPCRWFELLFSDASKATANMPSRFENHKVSSGQSHTTLCTRSALETTDILKTINESKAWGCQPPAQTLKNSSRARDCCWLTVANFPSNRQKCSVLHSDVPQ